MMDLWLFSESKLRTKFDTIQKRVLALARKGRTRNYINKEFLNT